MNFSKIGMQLFKSVTKCCNWWFSFSVWERIFFSFSQDWFTVLNNFPHLSNNFKAFRFVGFSGSSREKSTKPWNDIFVIRTSKMSVTGYIRHVLKNKESQVSNTHWIRCITHFLASISSIVFWKILTFLVRKQNNLVLTWRFDAFLLLITLPKILCMQITPWNRINIW